ncbi:MAG: hypothetical protein PHQ34_05315 [Methanothrix sp.]|nr:hypothetical protein [Methanothrix sp.]
MSRNKAMVGDDGNSRDKIAKLEVHSSGPESFSTQNLYMGSAISLFRVII